MEEYFERFESQPNCAQIYIDATFKREIWQEYMKSPQAPGLIFTLKL